MNSVIVIEDRRVFNKEAVQNKSHNNLDRLGKSASLILIAIMFAIGSVVALFFDIPVKSVMSNYSYDVLVILIVMELFTNLIAETGIMQLLEIKIAE